jgi:hypothetical protein
MDRWSEWLRELEALDPEDPAWETAPLFLQQLQELLARKEQERQHRTRLNHLRRRLEQELAGEIRFLGLDLRIPAEPSPEAFRTLDALCEALAEHARIREQIPKAPNMEVWEELAGRLRELAQEIRRMAETLPSPEEPASPSPMPPAPSLVEEAPPPSPEPGLPMEPETHEPITPPIPTAEVLPPPQPVPAPGPSAELPWLETFWAWVEEGDLPGAYWVARAAEAQGIPTPVPSTVLAILQGVRWLDRNREKMIPGIRARVEADPLPKTGPGAILIWAAALYGALAAPETGLGSCLEASPLGESAEPFLEAIRRFSMLGWPLTAREIRQSPAARLQEAEQAIRAVVARAQEWWTQAPQRTMNYQRATRVWQLLLKGRGEGYLDELLRWVREDRRDELPSLQKALERWEDPHYAERRILELADQVHIVGTAREQLKRRLGEACQLAREWMGRVTQWQHWRRLLEQEGWWHEQIQDLIRALQTHLPEVRADVETRWSASSRSEERVPLGWLLRALERLEALIHGREEPPSWSEPPWPLEGGLEAALALRLLWAPEIPQDESGFPLPESLPDVLRVLPRARAFEEAFEEWLARREYGPARRLIELSIPGASRARAEERLEEAFRSAREALRRRIHELIPRIEKEALEGILDEEQQSAFANRLEKIRRELEEGGERLVQRLRVLEEESRRLEEELREQREEHRRQILQRWQDLAPRLQPLIPDPSLWERIAQRIREAVDGENLQTAVNLLDHLEEVREGHALDQSLFAPPRPEQNPLDRFVQSLNAMAEFLAQQTLPELAELVRKERRLPREKLPSDRYNELANALEAWNALKFERIPPIPTDMRARLRSLVTFLGFQMERDWTAEPLHQEREWALYRISMRPTVQPVVYQYGTACDGKYDVLLLWERPGLEDIGGILERLNLASRPVLVFYFGRLLARQREDLAFMARRRHWLAVVLDEILLWFLGGEYENRLNAFLRCALPFTDLNPYTPFIAGSVPPEIFVGRRDMIRDLMDPGGPGLIYGGRQLGKSALLRQIEREFHRPASQQFAIYREIKRVGDPTGEDPQRIWRHLRQALVEADLLPRYTSEDPDDLERELLRAMERRPQLRILLLFDEADAFLKADAEQGFPIVSRIKQIMDRTGRRFRVVFTGLHNVQRFYNLSANHPLAHLGQPMRVGPLTPQEARELVVHPMEAIGFRFRTADPILRILAYTSRHPGLIQLFCKHLVDHLHKRPPGSLPPWEITREDVEAIYRQPEVRESIVDRFRWTLALDPHYEVITLAMCLDLRTAPYRRDPDYTIFELEKLAREHWPRGFQGMKTEDFRAYLDELEGLGILLRSGSGRYRLRSSSLPSLLGAPEWMGRRLEELSDQSPEPPLRIDDHHPPLDSRENRYSPMTFAQERRLAWQGYGVGLIFGSPALGLEDVPQAIRRLLPPEPVLGHPQHILEEIRTTARTEEGIAEALQDLLERHHEAIRLIALRRLPPGSTPEAIAAQIRGALKWRQKQGRSRRSPQVQVLFLFDPMATWMWLQLSEETRSSFESEAMAVITLRRWTLEGIRQRLRHHDWMDTDEACLAVLEATGGWSWLLDRFFAENRETDPRPAASQFRDRLREDVQFAQMFLRQIPLDVDPRILDVVKGLAREDDGKGIPMDLLPGLLSLSIKPEDFERIKDYLERMEVISIERSESMLYVDPVIRDLLGRA